ncbi:MAG TPA: DinB family protein [Acidobacteriaceae bacterium]|jgi:nucleotide-binding universal stress UspA family protein
MTDTATKTQQQPEPWLRGTLTDGPAVIRAVLHALELAREDAERWCGDLTGLDLNMRPAGLPPVAFHLRHVSGSVDRLLTYAEGRELSEEQLAELKREAEPAGALPRTLLREFRESMEHAAGRIRRFAGADLEAPRFVGRRRLPTTFGGLLVHIAEHTQRHIGQMVTTAKIVKASREAATSPGPQ